MSGLRLFTLVGRIRLLPAGPLIGTAQGFALRQSDLVGSLSVSVRHLLLLHGDRMLGILYLAADLVLSRTLRLGGLLGSVLFGLADIRATWAESFAWLQALKRPAATNETLTKAISLVILSVPPGSRRRLLTLPRRAPYRPRARAGGRGSAPAKSDT